MVERIEQYRSLIDQTAAEVGIDPSIIKGIIAAESGGDRYREAPSGYKGLMQAATDAKQFEPAVSIRTGTVKFKKFRDAWLGPRLKLLGVDLGAVDKATMVRWVTTAYNAGHVTVLKAVAYATQAGDPMRWMAPEHYRRALLFSGGYSVKTAARSCLKGLGGPELAAMLAAARGEDLNELRLKYGSEGGWNIARLQDALVDAATRERLKYSFRRKGCNWTKCPDPPSIDEVRGVVSPLLLCSIEFKHNRTPGYADKIVRYMQYFEQRTGGEREESEMSDNLYGESVKKRKARPYFGSTPTDALAAISQFSARTIQNPAFHQLSQAAIVARLKELVQEPFKIQQGELSLCGPAVFLRAWIHRDPLAFVNYTTGLFETGKGSIGNLAISPNSALKNSKPDPNWGIPEVDWVTMSSLRDSENSRLRYRGVPATGKLDELRAATLPSEIVKWLWATRVYEYIREETQLLSSMSLAHAKRQYFVPKADTIFMVHSSLLPGGGKKPGIFERANHFMLLQSQVVEWNNTVEFDFWSWGGTCCKTGHIGADGSCSRELSMPQGQCVGGSVLPKTTTRRTRGVFEDRYFGAIQAVTW